MDAELFRFINVQMSNAAFDLFFPWFTNIQRTQTFQFALLPLLLAFVFYKFRWRGIAAVAIGAFLTWVVDLFVSAAIKPLVLRPRPFDALTDVILRIPKPGSSSFPSGHSADAFFLATFLATLYPKAKWPCFIIAFLIAFSRAYLGVHYPGDILAGAVLGLLLGLLAGRLTLKWSYK